MCKGCGHCFLSLMKSVWYFNATAYGFTREPYCIMLPAYFVVFVAAVVRVLRAMGSVSAVIRVAVAVAMFYLGPGVGYAVDAVVMFSGVALFGVGEP